ncbi:MAG: hypothetical protein ACREV0_15050, partial [Burkholderiales bacterium]
MPEPLIAIVAVTLVLVLLLVWLAFKVWSVSRQVSDIPQAITQLVEEKHRAILKDLHEGLTHQGDRMAFALTENSERLRGTVDN